MKEGRNIKDTGNKEIIIKFRTFQNIELLTCQKSGEEAKYLSQLKRFSILEMNRGGILISELKDFSSKQFR